MTHPVQQIRKTRSSRNRRGSAYIAVLGATLIVATIGMGALSVVRSQRLAVTAQLNTAEARLLAESGIELGTQLIAGDANWRTNRTSGTWLNNVAFGPGTLTLTGVDADGSLTNRPTDSLTLTATAQKGAARQIVQATLVATGPALDCLSMAIQTAGQLHVATSKTLTLTGAPAATNGTASPDGGVNIVGDLQCLLNTGLGTVTGTVTILSTGRAMPNSTIPALYTSLGTVINPGSNLTKVVLTPTLNSLGATNPDGVYVINSSNDLTIKGMRLEGTLVVNCPGRTVTVDQAVFMHNYRADYPVLIVDGNLVLQYDSVGTQLLENSWGTNFNPTGAPYPFSGGTTNATTTDTYPDEIQGLVHCRGTLTLQSTARVRGAVICESSALSNAVYCNGSNEIVYTPSLATSPPMGYMKSVSMSVQSGSWKQVVLP